MPKRSNNSDWLEKWAKYNATSAPDFLKPVDTMSTGSPLLDLMLACGGWPLHTFSVVWGPHGSYKTALCQIIAGKFLAEGRPVVWYDAERRFNPFIAAKNGMDMNAELDGLPLAQIRRHGESGYDMSMENVFNELVAFCHSGMGGLMVLDSFQTLLDSGGLQSAEKGDWNAGYGGAKRAQFYGRYLPVLTGMAGQYKTTIIFVGQARANMNRQGPYDPEYRLNGGEAIKHQSNLLLRMIAGAKLRDSGEEVVGQRVNVFIEKNDFGPSLRNFKITARQDLEGQVFDIAQELADLAIKYGIIRQKNAWFSYDNGPSVAPFKWNGLEAVRQQFLTDEIFAAEIERKIKAKSLGIDEPEAEELQA